MLKMWLVLNEDMTTSKNQELKVIEIINLIHPSVFFKDFSYKNSVGRESTVIRSGSFIVSPVGRMG